MIASRWKLTLDPAGTPLVLVDHDQRIEAEMGFPWQQSGDARGRIGAPNAVRVGRGQASTEVAVTALQDHADDAAARGWIVALQPELATYSGRTAPLLLEIQGGSRYELPAVSLDTVESEVIPAPCARTATSYRLTGGGEWQSLPDPEAPDLDPLFVETVEDTAGRWMEVAFISPVLLTGSAAAGWTCTVDGVTIRTDLQQSTDLQTWTLGQFTGAAGYPVAVAGGWEYRARAVVPTRWNSVMTDLTATSDRAGKSITEIAVKGVPVSLPGYPYAMPAAAATLQAHLRAAGYTGATVTSVARPLTVSIRNYLSSGPFMMQSTVSGGAVTQVRAYIAGVWTPVSLPAYPYALPGSRATLQTHLRAAGYSGAVVQLLGDEWTIALPNVLASATNRSLIVTINPGDPFPAFDFAGNYVGDAPANMIVGTSGNVRTPAGAPLDEHPRQFARLKFTSP